MNAADPIRKGYADTPLGQIHFRRVGGEGPPVVLLHRTPVDSASFDNMLSLLADTRAAIALDTPGFGQSFRPPGSPSTVDYGHWLLAAIDALGLERFHLCAHHTGTHFAVEVARLAKGRILSLMLNGVLYADPVERAAMRREIGDAPPVDEAGQYLTGTWTVIKNLFSEFDPALAHTETLGALGSPTGRNQVFDAILSQGFASVLNEVTCPVRIVQASDDPLSGFLDRVRTAHPGIRIEIIGPAGIAAPELQPEAFTKSLLSFTAANGATSSKPITSGKTHS